MAGGLPSAHSQIGGRPAVGAGSVARALSEHYGLSGALDPLPSERDENFLVTIAGERRYVAKVANLAEDPAVLDLQHAAMMRLSAAGLGCPAALSARTGETVVRVQGHLFRVLTYLPGRMLADRPHRPAALLRHLGGFLAEVTTALSGFGHPAAQRHLQWDVQHAESVLSGYLPQVPVERRAVLERALAAFSERVAPVLPELRHSVVHNDANDHNVVVDGDGVTGLIDFGDMVRTVTLNELAVGCAYAALSQPDCRGAVELVAAGYDAVLPLSPADRRLLPDLVRTRLATSVAISAHQQALAPHDPYLSVSEAPAWRALTDLDRPVED